MNISRDALLRIIRAARKSAILAELIRQMGSNTCNMADQIFGSIADALFEISGDTNPTDNFGETQTFKFLTDSELSDDDVADEFVQMAGKNTVRQPGPILMTDAERKALYETPEGEWR